MANFLILVGGFTTYISAIKFSTSSNTLSYITQSAVGSGPSWLTQHPANSSIVYATEDQYYNSGNIHSTLLNPSTGVVTKISTISTQTKPGNGGDVWIEPLNDGTALVAANYNSGSVFFVPLSDDKLSFASNSAQLMSFTGSGPLSNQKGAHAHQAIAHGKEVLVPDLGSDKVWRLTQSGNGWVNTASISVAAGSGPRHCVPVDGNLYVIHEMGSAVTQWTLPEVSSNQTPQLVASFSIKPPDTTTTMPMKGGELIYAPSVTSGASPLLYASNRDDPSPLGDALAIFETTPALKLVKHVRTGLKHLRGVAFLGPNKEYIIAGGLNGGGIKVYKRVSADEGYLTEVAALNVTQISQPSTFVWVQV